jgi:wyosine [tRNA(Phe)-imidazoG37] synthetase (radical SAM superfamily)
VDLVPLKTCTFDCIYCQLGRTTHKTTERLEYAPIEQVIGQVRDRLAQIEPPDYVTLSGSGEPTLHSGLGQIIRAIKRATQVPVAILTNGSLFWDREVRRECAQADLVLPSLDAGDEAMFRYVNRPHRDLDFSQIVEGLVAFRSEFRGLIWLEVFLLGGITAFRSEVEKIQACVEQIAPERVQVNTAVRPPAEEFAFRVEEQRLAEMAALLGKRAEVIAEPACLEWKADAMARCEEVLDLLERRPSSIEDIAAGLGAPAAEITKCISNLLGNGAIRAIRQGGCVFFALQQPVGRRRPAVGV